MHRHAHALCQFLPASNNWAWQLGSHPAIVDMVAASLGVEDLILFSSQLAIKPPHGGEVVPWYSTP